MPTEQTDSGTQNYHLALETPTGLVKMSGDKTLVDARVQDGAVIQIVPEMVSGEPVLPIPENKRQTKERLCVAIIDRINGKLYQVEVPADVSVSKLIAALV